MGIWSATLFGSGGAIQWQRWQGTLEMLVAAPPPFVAVLLPLTVATSTIGIYSIVGDARSGAGSSSACRSTSRIPLQLAVALPVTVLSLGMLGLLLASTFILYRNANAFSNLLEYPVWLATGLLVPALAAPRLGRADLLGARADLGHGRDPRGGVRRRNAWPEIAHVRRRSGVVYLVLGIVRSCATSSGSRGSSATLSLT